MTKYNTMAVVVRTNTNHGIRCSAAQEKRLIQGLDRILQVGMPSEAEISRIVSSLPSSFFQSNGFDSPAQYARLLSEALDTDVTTVTPTTVTSVTNFNAPVQAQVIQTGPASSTKVLQNSHHNQLVTQRMLPALDNVSTALQHEIQDETERAQALKIIEEARAETVKPQPNSGKIRKLLLGLGKWTGERVTAAVDAALACAIDYGIKGGGP